MSESRSRPTGYTETSWCKAVPGGTGITILALLISKPINLTALQSSLHVLQNTHPTLRSKLICNPTSTNTFSLLTPPSTIPPSLTLQHFPASTTANIILSNNGPHHHNNVSPFHSILEHELNQNPWAEGPTEEFLFHARVYTLEEGEKTKQVVIMKVHTGGCDRTAAVTVLRDMMRIMMDGGDEGQKGEDEVMLGIEEYLPKEKTHKPFWARGVDMLGYSLNAFRLSNLKFVEPGVERSSRVVRLVVDPEHTAKLLEGCKARGIKLCGALSAAGLIAARMSKGLPDGEWEKYGVATLTDCRKLLEPALSNHHIGFYHSAIVNTHDIRGGEELWDLARRTYTSFQDSMNSNKHFSDMADLNFLMCKAIENPNLTPSSALRTSLVSVFEDPVIDETNESHNELGIEDYVGCASVHGIGPSIAIFDTIRDGTLDCACVYPSPLHSREQMQELIDNMKKILIDCTSHLPNEDL